MTDKERKIAREIRQGGFARGCGSCSTWGWAICRCRARRALYRAASRSAYGFATQIGSKLVNVLYILDEPSIGLHQRDNRRLIESLKELRDAGNSVIVVEHDEDMMRAADHIVDVGPLAGRRGGNIVAAGTFWTRCSRRIRSRPTISTACAAYPFRRRCARAAASCSRCAAPAATTSKTSTCRFRSASSSALPASAVRAKSTLVNETLRPILSRHLYRSFDQALECDGVEGIEHIDKLVVVDQSPIGRTPRSNPATYSGVFFGHTQALRVYARCSDTRLQGRPFLVQCQGRPLRGVPRCGSADYRDEFPARRLCAVPCLRRQTL